MRLVRSALIVAAFFLLTGVRYLTSGGVGGGGGGGDALVANPLSQFASTTSAQLAGVLSNETGTGASVFADTPTLIAPLLGTPTSGTLTNTTGLPVSTGIAGLGTGVATFLATPTSANLAAAVTGETGTGAAVFATSPTFVTPILGTPASGTLTNTTGLPIGGLTGLGTGVGTALGTAVTGSGGIVLATSAALTTPNLGTPSAGVLTNATGLPIAGITGLGTGVGTFLGTPSSANFLAAITDETGTGLAVANTDPQLNGLVKFDGTALGNPALRSSPFSASHLAVYRADNGDWAAIDAIEYAALLSGTNSRVLSLYAPGLSSGGTLQMSLNSGILWSNSATNAFGTMTLQLTQDAAATLQLGADLATPVDQKIKGSDGVGTDKNGSSLTLATGNLTGAGGGTLAYIGFNTTPAGASSSTPGTSTLRWKITSAGDFLAGTDNVPDIGASGATRPKNYYGAGFVDAVGGFKVNATAGITKTCTILPTQMVITGGLITSVTGGTCS